MRALAPLALVLPSVLLLACFEPDAAEERNPPGPRDPGDDTGVAAEDGGQGGDGGGQGGDGGGQGGDGGGEAPDPAEACHEAIADWPADWTAFEEEVVELTNQARARGADCGSYGRYAAAGPVEMEAHLQCAGRYHSWWMADTGTFDHYSYGGDLGDDPWARMSSAGFTGAGIGENIAAGYGSPAQVVQGWLDSDGHCANLMNASARLIGVGYAEGGPYGTYWTQEFGQ